MKKLFIGLILTICAIGCQKSELKLPQDQSKSTLYYKGANYSLEEGAKFQTETSIYLNFDFEEKKYYLFDNNGDALKYVQVHFPKYYDQIATHLTGNTTLDNQKDVIIPSESARTMISPSDFAIQFINKNCWDAPPYQLWNVNVASYPSGTINCIGCIGAVIPLSFGFTVPAGGSIIIEYRGFGYSPISSTSCQHLLTGITKTQCYNVYYPFCSGSNQWMKYGGANYFSWTLHY